MASSSSPRFTLVVFLAGTRTAMFIKASRVPVHPPLSGRAMEFDAAGRCAAGC